MERVYYPHRAYDGAPFDIEQSTAIPAPFSRKRGMVLHLLSLGITGSLA
jgi:hypothetical protein